MFSWPCFSVFPRVAMVFTKRLPSMFVIFFPVYVRLALSSQCLILSSISERLFTNTVQRSNYISVLNNLLQRSKYTSTRQPSLSNASLQGAGTGCRSDLITL